MIALYEKDATSFDDNGICILSPTSCTVKEVAGGQYELILEHPLDSMGKYAMLTEERLIKAPVPLTVIPTITLPEMKVWTVVTATTAYSKAPTKTYKNKNWKKIKKVKDNPLNYAWFATKYYNYGSLALLSNTVYEAAHANYNVQPGTNSYFWSALGTLNEAQPTTDTGSVVAQLTVGTQIYKIADVGDYMKIRLLDGKVGFVAVEDCEETTQRYQETITEQTITEQIFRIYRTSCDEETDTYTAYAKHISYDFVANKLYECNITDVSPNEAIAALQGALMNQDTRKIACDITGKTVTADWSFKNPVNALLDPDSGIVGILNARLVRNNNDFFILNSANPRTGITIKYGSNLLGVQWDRSIENVVTRVVPRSGNGSSGYTYIEDGGRISGATVLNEGKNYVESPIADEYQIPRTMVLNCSYTIGQEYEQANGDTAKYTEAEVKAKMKADAADKFLKDKVDGVDIQLNVNFLLLGDSEEYKQYKGLQRVNIYDILTIKTGKSNIDVTAQVTEYEYDCLLRRYNYVKVGTINSFNKRIAGYRFMNGSITYEKLSADLIDRIVTANASATTESDSEWGTATGGGELVAVPNTKDQDGIVTKGSGQASKVWKTDAQGNPDWREEAGVMVTDGDPTLAWGTRSTVGSVGGTDLHVTMPSNPDTWRPVVDNLNSTETDESLSANQGRILNGNINSLIKRKTVSGTTDAYGQIRLGLDTSTSAIICVGCYSNMYYHPVIEMVDNHSSAHFWQVRLYDNENNLKINTSTTLYVYYIETFTVVNS